ncbi:MAG: hypothetical protein ACTHLR_14095 [Rhizomicrobium sp.]
MHPFHLIPSLVFVLSWLGAGGAWATGAYSLVRVFTDGSLAAIEGHRSRAYRALALSVTFLVTGLLAGMATGAFASLHV